MSRIPIYQMTIGQNENGKIGLLFSDEEASFGNQSIVYAIPIRHDSRDLFEIVHDMERQEIYFPFEMEGKYYELDAKIRFPEFRFSIPESDTEIVFEAEQEQYWPEYFLRPFPRLVRQYKYVGNRGQLLQSYESFVSLLPYDIFEMDDLYLKRKGIFVGWTPAFNGETLNSNDRRSSPRE
jgi:hypothetical protein